MNTQTSYFKKALVVLMAVMMVFTMMPSMAWAAEETETGSSENVTSSIVASDTDGNINWSLDNQGTLTISKAVTNPDNDGSMKNYMSYKGGSAPWLKEGNAAKIVNAVIEEGVTSLGRSAFWKCENMQTIQLPMSLTSIGGNAFQKCTSLSSISIPDSVTNLGNQAFIDCTELKSVRFGKGLAGMVGGAPSIFFSKCSKLEKFVFPEEIKAYPTLWGSGHGKAVLICYTGTEEEWNKVSFVDADKEALKDAFMVYEYKEGKSGEKETFTTQPQNAAYIQGDEAQPLTAAIEQAKEGTEYHFQWYKNSVDSIEDATPVWGSETSGLTSTYIPGTGAENIGATYYFCRVYSVKNGVLAETDSSTASVTVTKATFNFKGEGSEENPWLIQSDDDMAMLKRLVNGGESMKNKYFKMTADITLPANWTPIGRTKNGSTDIDKGNNLNAFSGTLDGDNHKLTVPKGGKPLLGYVNGATVKNLKIYGEEINGYGLVNNFEGVDLSGSAIVIDNVKILEGTKIKKAGFLGGNITTNPFAGNSAGFTATIRNCEIEKGVTIGYDKAERMIGSFAGRMQGTIENCVSAADVYGADYVGGIIGTRDNAMGLCEVKNCTFSGSVNGSGKNTGGIVGGGYENSTAPNGIKVSIVCCDVDGMVNGNINVGGILGGDSYVAQVWNSYSVVGNTFSGKITGSENVGGIIGFYDSLNKFDNIAGNFYTKNCGAASGIGAVKYVDTNYKDPTKVTGTTYFNTEKGISGCPEVKGCNWKAEHNRTDDPLGADKENLTKAVDSIPTEAFCYELVVSGTPKTEYYIGDELDFSGATFTAKMTDGSEKTIDVKDITVSGYNKNSNSVQTITLSYGFAKAEIQVVVLKKESGDVKEDTLTIQFKLLGDSKHDSDVDKNVHGLATGGLSTWESGTYEMKLNSTVWNLLQKVQEQNNKVTFNARGSQYGTYVYSVTYNGTEIGELDNGKLSGWMYTVNGTHPEIGVGSKFLNNGDTVIFHYTDDYTKEEGSDKWNAGGVVEEVKNVTTDTKTKTTTAPTEVKVSEKTNVDGTKTKIAEVRVSADNQKEILKQAKEKKSNEIILSVSKSAVGDAAKADVRLDKSFIDSIVKDTDAKLTIKTPFGDKTYTQEELKAMSEAATGSTIIVSIEKTAEQPADDDAAKAEKIAKARSIVKDMKLVARSCKTTKKNIKAVLKSDAKTKASVQELKDLGFTVKYRFYRSTKKASSYKPAVTKKTASYTNTSGKKGTKYFYKVQVRVYDENGKLIAKTALKQCKYASRTWTK